MTLEWLFRGGAFVVVIALVAAAEALSPMRPRHAGRAARVVDNLALLLTGSLLARLLLPASAVGAAFLAQRHDVGLFHLVDLPFGVAFVASLVALDLSLYAQHLALHALTPLWRLHRVHHSDTDLDLSTGIRFHPGEFLVSLLYKALVAAALGAPPAAVLVFEVVLNACSLFNHANLGLPPRLERGLRRVLVTPAMHWVHHSADPRDARSNFGFCLSLWDRLFGTYRAAPADGLERMRPGVSGCDEQARGVWALMRQPFTRVAGAEGDYLLGREP